MSRGRRILGLGGAAILVSVYLVPVHVLQIVAAKTGRVVFTRLARRHETFSLSFIHSVERSPVEDFFVIDADYRLTLFETRFRSLNTGLPYAAFGNERFQRDADGFRISNMSRTLPALELWVHQDYENTLRLGTERVRLPLLAGNTLLRLSVNRIFLGTYFFLRLAS